MQKYPALNEINPGKENEINMNIVYGFLFDNFIKGNFSYLKRLKKKNSS